MHRIIHLRKRVVNTKKTFVFIFCIMPYSYAFAEEIWLKYHKAIHHITYDYAIEMHVEQSTVRKTILLFLPPAEISWRSRVVYDR